MFCEIIIEFQAYDTVYLKRIGFPESVFANPQTEKMK